MKISCLFGFHEWKILREVKDRKLFRQCRNCGKLQWTDLDIKYDYRKWRNCK